jgi:hypothetical protein
MGRWADRGGAAQQTDRSAYRLVKDVLSAYLPICLSAHLPNCPSAYLPSCSKSASLDRLTRLSDGGVQYSDCLGQE